MIYLTRRDLKEAAIFAPSRISVYRKGWGMSLGNSMGKSGGP